MRRFSRLWSRSARESPKLPRDQTQEEIILRSDDSDSDRDMVDGRTSVEVQDIGNGTKSKVVSTTSGGVSAASSEALLDRELAKRLQEVLFEGVANDSVDEVKAAVQDIEKHNLSLELPDLCDPDTSGMTVLHSALEQRKLNVAQYLIETQKKSFLSATYVNITKQIPPSRKSSLHIAAEIGNQELMEKLLKKLFSEEQTNFCDNWLRLTASDVKTEQVVIRHDKLGKRRVSTMHLAALNGHTALIQTLLNYKFEIDADDSENETALSLAVQMGHIETARQLIACRAGVDHANSYGCTPLHLAVSLGRRDMVKLLLNEGKSDVNVERIKSPKTPIEMAANRLAVKIVRTLLKTTIKLEYRHQAMMLAARKGNLDIVSCILENDVEKLLNRPDDNGNTVLLEAASGGYVPTVKYLVALNADLYWKNHARQTVFDIAMFQSSNALLQYLLEIHREKKRDLKREAFYLHVAAANGDIKKIEYLLASGIDFYALDEHQNTFLHTAAFHNRPNVLEKFITPDDDIDTLRNCDGETPIHIAAKRGYYHCVEHLLTSKSKLAIADKSGHTPLHAALSSTTVSSRIVAALTEAIRNTNAAILNEQDVLGRTALHLATAGKRPEILKFLADLDPEIENKAGDTPLHVAAEFGTGEVLEAYLDEFCGSKKLGKIDHKDVDGFSALHRCAAVADAHKVDLMLDNGADLALTNEDGMTVLHTMVDSYVNNPNLDDKLVQVYQTIVASATKWYCWKNDIRVPREESKEFYLTQLDAVCLLVTGMFSQGLNAIQYASKKGAAKLLKEMLNTPNVFRFNKNKPAALKGRGLEELNDLGSMNKKHEQKRTLLIYLKRDEVLFDVSYLVPGLMPKPVSDVVGNPLAKTHNTGNRSALSCLELIVSGSDEDVTLDILIEDPFRSLVSNYWKLCRRTYEAFMWIHVIFMICFTYFVMPSNAWLHWRFGTNSSTADPEDYAPSSSPFYPKALFGVFLLWPVCNLLYSLGSALDAVCSAQSWKDLFSGSFIRKLKIGEITSGLLRIPIGILLFVFDNLSQISALAFGTSYVAWYVMFVHADNAHRYLECLAMSFIFGWLHTISFVKGFKDWNAMAAILKQVLLKDITRFIYIYIFILISFGYAIHAIIQADYHLDPDYRSPTSTIYLTFYRMLSPGNVLDVSESDDYKRSGGSVSVLRAVCSAYSILSSVVLMNMLIAMMNSTYSDVKAEKSAAWRIESLRMALWMERHFPLRRFKFLCLKKTLYDSTRNRWYMTYKPEDGHQEWGAEELGSDKSSSSDEESEDERKAAELQQDTTISALRTEVAKIREELHAKSDEEKEMMKCIVELRSQLRQIHEVCRETSQLVRVRSTRPEETK